MVPTAARGGSFPIVGSGPGGSRGTAGDPSGDTEQTALPISPGSHHANLQPVTPSGIVDGDGEGCGDGAKQMERQESMDRDTQGER